MQDESKRLSVAITFGERGTVYGCGHALDTMLYAYGLTTEDSLWEWNADAEHEAMSYALNEYDWEEYTRDRLNDGLAAAMLQEVLDAKIPVGVVYAKKIDEGEYMPGDWLRFNIPEALGALVRIDRERISELVRDNMGDWSSDQIPEDLKKDLVSACESAQKSIHDEWLHGDRSNDGVLRQLAQAIFGRYTDAEVEWEPKTDTVTISATADEWREWMGYDLDEREPLPEPAKLAEHMRDTTLYKAQGVKEARRKVSESRAEERQRQEERKRLQLEEEKEEARQRKVQKKQKEEARQ